MPKKKAMIAVIHSVQRQPRDEVTMKDPAMGPATGPTKTAVLKIVTATPRSTGIQISFIVAPTIASGADAKRPPKNRQIMMV